MTEERFWDSTPRDLEPYVEAQKMRQAADVQQANFNCWLQGIYFREAIASSVFVANLPQKRIRLPAYMKQPMEIDPQKLAAEDEEKPMSEQEIEMARLRERIKMDSLCRALKERFSKRG